MFHLRRAIVRSLSSQPLRTSPVSIVKARASFLPTINPSQYRLLSQTILRLADESRDPANASQTPAEANQEDGAVTEEPSLEEQRQEIREESIVAPDVADAAESQSSSEKISSTLSSAGRYAQGKAAQAKDTVSAAAQNAAEASGLAARGPRESGEREPSRIVYVGNLFFEVTTANLEAEFARFGEIVNSKLVTDDRGLSKGFAFVEFADQAAADQAIRDLDQTQFQGRRMTVQYHIRRTTNKKFATQNAAPSSSNPPAKTLFIGNMSYRMSDKDLNDLFREIKNVIDVRVAIDRRTGQPRGFAHADFVDIEAATKAKELLERQVIYGRPLRVDFGRSSTMNRSES